MSQAESIRGMHTSAPQLSARSVGARVARAEDPRLLSGGGRYLADVKLPGELHCTFVRSNIAHGEIESIDTSLARESPGVVAVWTFDDIEDICAGVAGEFNVDGCVPTLMPLLAGRAVHYVGEPLAVVVAQSRARAEDAAELVDVTLKELPAVVDPNAAYDGGHAANSQLPDNIGLRGGGSYGKVEEAFSSAHKVIEATYHPGRVSATPMETRGCIAHFDWMSQRLRVWSSTQIPHSLRGFLAAELGFLEHNIEVLTPDTGGGFGQKAHVYPEEFVIPLLARALGAPVKWVEDRRENLMAASHGHEQYVTIAYALDEDARITGSRLRALSDGGAYHSLVWSMAVEAWCAAVVTPTGIYNIPATEYIYEAVATNKSPTGAYRGVGYTAGTLAREVLADEAARSYNLSPFEFRRRNVVSSFPWQNPQGITYEEGSWLESIDALEAAVNYPTFLTNQQHARDEGKVLGLGISVFVESTAESTAMLKAHGAGATYHDTATVRLDPSGYATVTSGLTTQGQGNRTTLAQVAADTLGIPVEHVRVISGESTDHAHGSGTLASRGAVIGSGMVARASVVLREKILAVASQMLEAPVADLELLEGSVVVRGVPDSRLNVADVCAAIYYDPTTWPEGFDPTLEVTRAYDSARPTFSNGAFAVQVEIDPETGFVDVTRVIAISDCGTVINPNIVEGQIRGGLVQGIGATFFEELVYDEAGQLQTTTLLDYQIPTADVAPVVEIHHLETPSVHTAFGIKGMGESGLIGSPAALLNAVNDALAPYGSAIRELPVTPEKVLRALGVIS